MDRNSTEAQDARIALTWQALHAQDDGDDDTLRLDGESFSACVNRLIENLARISLDLDNYEQHFGEQRKGRFIPSGDALRDDKK